MRRPIGSPTLSALQLAGAAAVGLACLALLVAGDRGGERFYLVRHAADGAWITAPQPEPQARAIPLSRTDPPRHRFVRRVHLDAPPERAPVEVRALRELELRVNGEPVPLPGREPHRWKDAVRVDLAPWLRAGENVLVATVTHDRGPPLLQVRSGAAPEFATGPRGWWVERDGLSGRVAAVVADDVRRFRRPSGGPLPSPSRALAERVVPLGLIFVLCAAPAALGLRTPRALAGARLPWLAFAAVAVFWTALFVRKGLGMSTVIGFDTAGHLDYVARLAESWRLPRADESWETFQPPLYYAAAAALRRIFDPARDSTLDRALLRLLPMLSGLLAAGAAGLTARRLVPDAPRVAAVATLAAGLLPVHVLLSTFVSNEPVHTFFTAAALLVTTHLLRAPRAGVGGLAALAGLLGAALLTKSLTAAPLALLLPAMVAGKLWAVEARPAPRAAGAFLALLAGPVVLAGWFYARNWWLFGDPFVTNLDAFAAWTYWIPPGFHTPAWYLGFGEVLRQPFFASFHSFADGLYSSFWGDGYASGAAGVKYPHPYWDYDAMAAVYPLALPATGLLLYGFARMGRAALAGDDAGRRLAFTTLLLVAFGMSFMLLLGTLRVPFNALPKAFYALPALVPAAVAFALGVEGVHRRGRGRARRALRAALAGYGGVLAAGIAEAFLG